MGKNDRDWHQRKRDSIRKKRETLDRMDKALADQDWEELKKASDDFTKENKRDRIKKRKQ